MREDALRPYLGKRQEFTATIGRITEDKVMLVDVCVNGKQFHHTWVQRSRIEKAEGAKRYWKISFTAVPIEYIGLDGYKQVIKAGLKGVSKIRYINKKTKKEIDAMRIKKAGNPNR